MNFLVHNPKNARRRAFSLMEILVVLSIMATVAALCLGAYHSFSQGERRTNCTANLAQIYRAARLYADDFGAFVPYDPATQIGGLPILLGVERDGQSSERARASSGYLRKSSALHCPSDTRATSLTQIVSGTPQINPAYLSYQTNDGTTPTYQPARVRTFNDADYARQLLHYHPTGYWLDLPPASNTIITWCQWHRGLSSRPDNVLFYDGSVRRMSVSQSACAGSNRTTWRRLPNCDTGEGAPLPTAVP